MGNLSAVFNLIAQKVLENKIDAHSTQLIPYDLPKSSYLVKQLRMMKIKNIKK